MASLVPKVNLRTRNTSNGEPLCCSRFAMRSVNVRCFLLLSLSRPEGDCYSAVMLDSSGHRRLAPGPAPEALECATAQGLDRIPIQLRLHLRGLRDVPSRLACRARGR